MKDGQQWVHFLGICGRASAGVAGVMKKLGWYVTGSDNGAYSPIPEYLNSKGIEFNQNYDAGHIDSDMDLVVVGGNTLHVDPNNLELRAAQDLNLEITSWPELIGKYMVKENNLVIVGTYGKTSITALIVKILHDSGFDPTYMIGDPVPDLADHTYLGNSDFSVFEGDEHPTLGYSTQPKFSYFPPKYLLITSAIWDHFNIYKTEEEFVNVFKNLVKNIPEDGWVVASNHHSLSFVKELAKCSVYVYGEKDADYLYEYKREVPTKVRISGKLNLKLESKLIGKHNVENLLAASTACSLMGVADEKIIQAVKDFRGPINRLQETWRKSENAIYKDVGQHPLKAKGAIDGLKEWFPDHQLTVVLDPHASVYKTREVLNFLPQGFRNADRVLVSRINLNGVNKEDRVSGAEIVEIFIKSGISAEYIPDEEILIDKIVIDLRNKKSNVLILSSGGFNNVPNRIIDKLNNDGN